MERPPHRALLPGVGPIQGASLRHRQPTTGQPLTGQPATGNPVTGQEFTSQEFTCQPVTGQLATGQPGNSQPINNHWSSSHHSLEIVFQVQTCSLLLHTYVCNSSPCLLQLFLDY